MKTAQKAFTLIELLIVIAVLGILAIAVLAAINPIEQINRSRDTGSRSDAEQLISAIDRYYASVGFYPWMSTSTSNEATGWEAVDAASWVDDAASPVLAKLGSSTGGTSELKESFTDRITQATYNTMFVYNRGTQGDSTYVCFEPQSGSFKDEAERRCDAGLPDDLSAIDATVCNDGADTYYSCLP